MIHQHQKNGANNEQYHFAFQNANFFRSAESLLGNAEIVPTKFLLMDLPYFFDQELPYDNLINAFDGMDIMDKKKTPNRFLAAVLIYASEVIDREGSVIAIWSSLEQQDILLEYLQDLVNEIDDSSTLD